MNPPGFPPPGNFYPNGPYNPNGNAAGIYPAPPHYPPPHNYHMNPAFHPLNQAQYKPPMTIELTNKELANFSTNYLAASVVELLESNSKAALEAVAPEEAPGVFSCELLSQDWSFLEEILRLRKDDQSFAGQLTSLHGVSMSMLGFNDFFRELAKVLTQLLAHGNHGAAPTVEYKHSFVLAYERGAGHFCHSDPDSDLTVNLCLKNSTGKKHVGKWPKYTNGELFVAARDRDDPTKQYKAPRLIPDNLRDQKVLNQTFMYPLQVIGYGYNGGQGEAAEWVRWVSAYPKEDVSNQFTKFQSMNFYVLKQVPNRCLIHSGFQQHSSQPAGDQTPARLNIVMFFKLIYSFYRFMDLPEDIQLQIASYLTVHDALSLARASKATYTRIAPSRPLWKLFYDRFVSMAEKIRTTDIQLPSPCFPPLTPWTEADAKSVFVAYYAQLRQYLNQANASRSRGMTFPVKSMTSEVQQGPGTQFIPSLLEEQKIPFCAIQ